MKAQAEQVFKTSKARSQRAEGCAREIRAVSQPSTRTRRMAEASAHSRVATTTAPAMFDCP
jgi:hypothetical protein